MLALKELAKVIDLGFVWFYKFFQTAYSNKGLFAHKFLNTRLEMLSELKEHPLANVRHAKVWFLRFVKAIQEERMSMLEIGAEKMGVYKYLALNK